MSRTKKYRMKAIPSAISEKGGYSAQFVGDGYTVDACKEILPGVIKDIGAQIGEGTAWDLVRTFLLRCAKRVAETGETVTLGSLMTFALAIRGWFANKDSKASKDNVRVSAKLLDELRPTVVFSMSNDIDGVTLTLYTVMGDGCALGHVKPAAAFRINGKYLQLLEGDKVVASVKDAAGETIEAECAVIESAEDHIDATLPAAFGAAALAGCEITFTVHGRCGDADAGTQVKSITAVLDKGELREPKVTGYKQSGMEGITTEANELFQGGGDPSFSGVNLAGASVKVITDGSTLEIPGEHVTATDTQVTIAKSYLDEQDLFASIGDDAEFVFTTANGTASFTCLIAG